MEEKKYTPQNNHTQEKLRVFSSYLDIYLTILLSPSYINRVYIYDMFAGKGRYETDERTDEGSAALALKIIKKHREKSGKDVRLYLNDSKASNYQSLVEITRPDINKWVFCQQEDANDAINKHVENIGSKIYKLFYLDPFGYSQIKKKTLDRIIHSPYTECLLFVPVARIVQFVDKNSTTEEQIPPIKKFLIEYGINTEDHKDAKWRDWGRIIRDAFAKTYSGKHVGMAEFSAPGHNYYALYFIGSHRLGLDRFLEAHATQQSQKEHQLVLFSSDDEEIHKYLSEGTKTNIDIYIWGLGQGWAPSKTKTALKNLENDGKINIKCPAGETRRKGNFYLRYKYDKEQKIKIEVSLVKQS